MMTALSNSSGSGASTAMACTSDPQRLTALGCVGNRTQTLATPPWAMEEANLQFAELMSPLAVLLALFMLIGIIGNMMVIIISTKNQRKTAASYYILTLAAIDLFSCIVILPFIIAKLFNRFAQTNVAQCKIFEFLNHAILSISVCLLTSISIDRFYAVCRPHQYIQTSSYDRLKVLMAGCFGLGTFVSFPILEFYGKKTVVLLGSEGKFQGIVCHFSDAYDGSLPQAIYSTLMLIIFVSCVSIIIVMYGRITIQVLRKKRSVGVMPVTTTGLTKDARPQYNMFLIKEPKKEAEKDFRDELGPSTSGESAKAEQEQSNEHNPSTETYVDIKKAHDDTSREKLKPDSKLYGEKITENTVYNEKRNIDVEGSQKELNSKTNPSLATNDKQLSTPKTKVVLNASQLKTTSAACMNSPSDDPRHQICVDHVRLAWQNPALNINAKRGPQVPVTMPPLAQNNTQRLRQTDKKLCVGRTRRVIHPSTVAQRSKASKVLLVMTLVFLLSWFPFWFLKIARVINPSFWSQRSKFEELLEYSLNHAFYINNFANPIIYSISSAHFRRQFKKLLINAQQCGSK